MNQLRPNGVLLGGSLVISSAGPEAAILVLCSRQSPTIRPDDALSGVRPCDLTKHDLHDATGRGRGQSVAYGCPRVHAGELAQLPPSE